MSVFGTNQVEGLIVGNAVAAETTAKTFISTATDKEIKVLSADGSAPAVGEDFKIYQKTATGYEYSPKIDANDVDKVVLATYSAEVQKLVTATVATATAETTYVLEVRVYGDLSRENFDIVSGYYVTGSVAPTKQVIRDGLLASLQYNFTKRGDNEVILATSLTDAITITGKAQAVVVGKIQGRQVDFDVVGKSFRNAAIITENQGEITVVVSNENSAGTGTGKYAVNLEWFLNGFKYDVYRQTAYPADFTTPVYTDATKTYNVIHVIYNNTRKYTSTEKQRKVTTILVEYTNLASNAATNAVLTDLRTILGTANVPAALATV